MIETIIVYLIATVLLIRHILKESKYCPYCGKKMHSKRESFGTMWSCRCGCQMWVLKRK